MFSCLGMSDLSRTVTSVRCGSLLPSGSADLREAHSGPATPMRMRSAAKADIAMFPDPAESGSMEEAVQQRTRGADRAPAKER